MNKIKTQLSRNQRRYIERANTHANQTFGKLADQYMEVFFEFPPQSEEVKEKAEEVISKWKLYCKLRELKSEVKPNMEEWVNGINEKYKAARNETDGND